MQLLTTKKKNLKNILTTKIAHFRNVERVNSLKARLDTKDILKDGWEKSLGEKYSSMQLSRKDSLKQVKEE